MDKEIIKRFRDEVNAQDLVLQMYRNYAGKNYWNIICSAMDWIDVVVEMIDIKNVSKKNDNDSSIKVMTFIMCIDVMWEAVQQLHRIFFDTSTIPFADNTEVFCHKLFQASDNDYFKTIRACFAAHPINLNDHFTGNKQKERRYASWSGGGFSSGDFSVMLYSNQPDKDALFLDIYFDELLKFAEQRYAYLNTISTKIVWQREQYLNSWKSIKIERTGSLDEQILVLIKEAKQRFDNDYYNYELKYSDSYVEIAMGNPLSQKDILTVEDLKTLSCILVVSKGYEDSEKSFYEKDLAISHQFLYVDSLEQARLMVAGNRGYLPIDVLGEMMTPIQGIKRVPLYKNGKPIQRNYFACWHKQHTNYYIEEFAQMLRTVFQ